MSYNIKRIPNYEGFKRIDQMQEKIAEGRLKPPREAAKDYRCALCRLVVRAIKLVPSRLMGESVRTLLPEAKAPLTGNFVMVCPDCERKFAGMVA